MSSKKLIVASNTSAIRNILENNIDSILIDPNDISKWINFFENDIHHIDKKNLINNSYNKFINNFTWSIRVEKILKAIIYENITHN